MQAEAAKTVDFSAQTAGPAAILAWLKPQAHGDAQRHYDTALRTIALLQTTLELHPLLRLFSRAVGATVSHSSVRYHNGRPGVDLTVGRSARYRRTFHVIVEKQDLGQLTFTRGKPFTARETALLEFLLSSVAYPLRNALQYEDAFQASLTDPLTGVYNRSMLESSLHREVSLARRHNVPLSLIILDIDEFKVVNDKFGHDTGDNLIKAVARSVAGSLRKTDIFCRFGGDEFALLLSNTSEQGAVVLAETIRKRIEGITRIFDHHAVKVTVSIGVASLSPTENHETLFSRADEALFRAKGAGRNCIKVANAA